MPHLTQLLNTIQLTVNDMTRSLSQSFRKVNGGCQSFYEIDADPKFTDFANGDFTLASDSSCIDNGPSDAAVQ